nr:histidinol-phosphatase [Vulcaniibacterium gelatinicum]
MSGRAPILFVDRDGTLIEEPADFQVDDFRKLRFVPGCIPALLRLRDAGYQFVMVTNQDGLGTPAFPREAFEGPQALLMQLLESQGIVFREVLIDPSLPEENSPNRKPGIGMALHLLRDRSVDWSRSAVIGDRETDLEFARNLGVRGFKLRTPRFGDGDDWATIAHLLADAPRIARVERRTRETTIAVDVDLDREAEPRVRTGLGFLDHMLEQLGKHGGFALTVQTEGDLHVDEHHTVEDTAIVLGQALREALGDKRGIQRFGWSGRFHPGIAQTSPAQAQPEPAPDGSSESPLDPRSAHPCADETPIASEFRYGFTLPMDEALASAALDVSGRAHFQFEGAFRRERVGDLPTELVPHFFRSLCDAAGFTLHLTVRGDNDHHQVEACFKVVARALRQALRREGDALPSTKGVL